MLSVFLFVAFLVVYSYLFVSSAKAAPVVPTIAPVTDVEIPLPAVAPTELPDLTIEEVLAPCYAPAVAMAISPIECIVSADPGYSAMSSAQLRKACTTAGIKWRNAHGKKHLSKAEMIAALQ